MKKTRVRTGIHLLQQIGFVLLVASCSMLPAERRTMASGSMEPTIPAETIVLIDKSIYQSQDPQRGDVIIYQASEAAMAASYTTAPYDAIHRIIGLPGETIEVRDGKVFVDGEVLSEPYTTEPIGYTWGPETIPENQYFVLGDNRNSSLDSHIWGFISRESILGKVNL